MNLRKRLLGPLAAAALAVGAINPAAAVTYSFGDLLSPSSGDPDGGAIWGTLSITDIGSNSYSFFLSLDSSFDDPNVFGSSAFLTKAIFNNIAPVQQIDVALEDGSWGVRTVTASSAPNVGGFTFDFGDAFGNNSNGRNADRLLAGESVSWTSTFSSGLTLVSPYIGLHVQGISTANGFDSAWYQPTSPVPEPETYAMLLAGLALVGFAARRRRQGRLQPA